MIQLTLFIALIVFFFAAAILHNANAREFSATFHFAAEIFTSAFVTTTFGAGKFGAGSFHFLAHAAAFHVVEFAAIFFAFVPFWLAALAFAFEFTFLMTFAATTVFKLRFAALFFEFASAISFAAAIPLHITVWLSETATSAAASFVLKLSAATAEAIVIKARHNRFSQSNIWRIAPPIKF